MAQVRKYVSWVVTYGAHLTSKLEMTNCHRENWYQFDKSVRYRSFTAQQVKQNRLKRSIKREKVNVFLSFSSSRYSSDFRKKTLPTIFTRLVHQIRDSIPALALGHAILVKCLSIEITPSTTSNLKLVLRPYGCFEYSKNEISVLIFTHEYACIKTLTRMLKGQPWQGWWRWCLPYLGSW